MKYKFSDNIIIYRINKDYKFAYHSLYGNGRIISTELASVIERDKVFMKEDLIELIGEEVFNELQAIKFLFSYGSDERTFMESELKLREELLSKGYFYDRLHLSTTNKCNMNCKYCFCNTFNYESDNNLGVNKENDNGRFAKSELSFEIAKKAIDNTIDIIKNNNKNAMSIEFFGGEPFLNSGVISDILGYLGNGDKQGINVSYGITSNGTVIPDNLLPALKDNSVRIGISLDYIDQESSSYRGDGSTNIKWSTIDTNIRNLISNGIEVTLQSVLSEETWDKFNHNIIDYSKKVGIKKIGIIMSFDFDFYRKMTPKKIADKVLEMYDYGTKLGIDMSGYWYQTFWGIVNPDLWEARRAWKTCPTIGRLLSVEPDGRVFACKTTSKVLGYVNSFDNIFKSENYKYYAMRAYSNSDKCVGCELEGFCSGNCTGAVENKFNSIYDSDDYYCQTIKVIVKGLLSRYFKELENSLKLGYY